MFRRNRFEKWGCETFFLGQKSGNKLGFVKVTTLFPEKHCFVKHLSTLKQHEMRKVMVTNVLGFIVNP